MEFFVRYQIDSPGLKVFGGTGGGGVFFGGVYRLGFGYLAVPCLLHREQQRKAQRALRLYLRLRAFAVQITKNIMQLPSTETRGMSS
jgi:hypothetical protein